MPRRIQIKNWDSFRYPSRSRVVTTVKFLKFYDEGHTVVSLRMEGYWPEPTYLHSTGQQSIPVAAVPSVNSTDYVNREGNLADMGLVAVR